MDATNGTLLIVDDEEDIREIISMHVMSLGVRVLEASDGETALTSLQHEHVDVIVSDLMMPRVSGLALLGAMRGIGLMQPFIFVTAYPSQETTAQALRLGAFDYIEKPFDGDNLRAHVVEALRVSREMLRLGIRYVAVAADAHGTTDDRAILQIQKLRTLRYAESGPVAGQTPQAASEAQRKLTELFIGEATAQLLFCQSSIRNLADPEQNAMECGYLFRVMQGIADAAQSLGAVSVASFSRAAEQFYTRLRVHPQLITPNALNVALTTNISLQTLVSTLGTAEEVSVDTSRLVAEMEKVNVGFAKAG